MSNNPTNTTPPTFPPKCRDEGHEFVRATERNPFDGRPQDKTYCAQCGIDRYKASFWMSRALEAEVKGLTDAR